MRGRSQGLNTMDRGKFSGERSPIGWWGDRSPGDDRNDRAGALQTVCHKLGISVDR